MSKNKYVGKKATVNGRESVIIYADRAGIVVEFEDGSQWMGPVKSAKIEG